MHSLNCYECPIKYLTSFGHWACRLTNNNSKPVAVDKYVDDYFYKNIFTRHPSCLLAHAQEKEKEAISMDKLYKKAQDAIERYMQREFENKSPYKLSLSNLKNIELAATTTEDEVFDITSTLNLCDFRIDIKVDNVVVKTEQYKSLEDIVEEIFGDIEDEHDSSNYVARRTDNGDYILSARLEIDKVNEMFGLDLPDSEDYMTVGGLILYYYQSFPKLNEVVKVGKFEFKIIKNTRTKIELVRLHVGEE